MRKKVCGSLLLLFWLAAAAEARPRLVFLLIIDQFRADYLQRFRADFVPGGFQRLLRQGAVFANNAFNHSSTETAPGHATIATGAEPAAHGVVGNSWYDRQQKKVVTSVEDAAVRLVGVESKGPGASPRNLAGTTLADEIRLAFGGQAVAISLKDRAAILPGGKNPTAVFWIDASRSGRAVSSTYYLDRLPAWVEEINQKFGLSVYEGREWRALGAKPGDPPLAVIGKPGTPVTAPASSPFGNDTVMELARRAVKEYKLGQSKTTDFLSVSLSSNDYVGHDYGPDSPQVADITRRTDRLLADFFAYLDKSVGPGAWVLAFTADHGAAPNPELFQKQRYDAGRIQGKDVTEPVEAALRAAYSSAAEEKWVAAQDLPDLYLDHDLLAKYRVTQEDAARRTCQAVRAVRGIYDCYTPAQLAAGRGDAGALGRAVKSYLPGRSGDVLVIFSPFWVRDYPNLAANHGTPWSYDSHVPLIFMGPGFKPGVYQTPSTPADLAVTLAALLGITPPAVATGRVLDVAFTGH
jgi:predicted AlkP superfamily pyrophosphatase or phosphodiesterase